MSNLIDRLSDYLANRKGLLPIIGSGLVVLNFLLVLFIPNAPIARTNLLLHLGILIALFGFLIGKIL